MATNFPTSVDDFATTSPTNLGDDDAKGRTHSERHNDMESAMEAVQALLRASSVNLLHNPAMEIWQRGTASTSCTASALTYLADRWFVRPEGAATTQERSTTVPTGSRARYSVKVTGATSVTTVDFGQRVEAANVPPLARTVTFSWNVYNATGTSITPSLRIGTPGAADDFTTVTNRLDQNLQAAADAGWTTVSHTVDISGYTNLANGIEVVLRFPSGSVVAGDYVLVTEAQATASAGPVEFTRPGARTELADCQRYFVATPGLAYAQIGWAQATSSTNCEGSFELPVPMRVQPTVSAANVDKFVLVYPSANATPSAVTVAASTGNSAVQLTWTVTGATSARMYRARAANDATAILYFSAELA